MALRLDSSTMRVNSCLKSYHRFLSFNSLSDFLGNLDERVSLVNITMRVTVRLRYYVCSHGRHSQLTARDGCKSSRRPIQHVSSHEVPITSGSLLDITLLASSSHFLVVGDSKLRYVGLNASLEVVPQKGHDRQELRQHPS